MTAPKSLIINSPFECPSHHWRRDEQERFALVAGRRPAGYEIFDTRNNTVRRVELPLVNRIRERVDEWRAAGRPGGTAVTRQLLEHCGVARQPSLLHPGLRAAAGERQAPGPGDQG